MSIGAEGTPDRSAAEPRRRRLAATPVDAGLAVLWRRFARDLANADAVHATLREGILSGLLAAGERLGEESLAAQFGVSRTPVHEALMRLEAERLVARVRRRGLVVSSISAEQVLEVYAIR